MKTLFSVVLMLLLVSCGKKIEDRSKNDGDASDKLFLMDPETWIIQSDIPLPSKIRVLINSTEFLNECTKKGNASVERTANNGTVSISTFTVFREEYFNVEIYDCKNDLEFYNQQYVDQMVIKHPRSNQTRIVLRLRN